MKRVHLYTHLLLGALVLFGPRLAWAYPSPDQATANQAGTTLATSGSETYALNQSLTGVASSVIDLRSSAGVLFSVTGTALYSVNVEWNNVSYTTSTWYQGAAVQVNSNGFIAKQAKWLRFRLSTLAPPTTRCSLWYSLVGASDVLLSSLTATAGTDQTSYTNVTTVAYGEWTTHTASTYDLTYTASLAIPLQVWMSAGQGGAAIRYHVDTNATAPTWLASRGWYSASTSTVQVSGRWAPGHRLHVISVGSTSVQGTVTLVK